MNLPAYSFRVASYVTAYQDAQALQRHITSIFEQTVDVHKILVFDNSPNSLEFIIKDCDWDRQRIIWLHCPDNRGIAFGLNWALDWSSRNAFDFLWIFDQDSVPSPDCLDKLLNSYLNLRHQKIGIIACTAIDPRSQKIIAPCQFVRDRFIGMEVNSLIEPYECDAPITSGSLLNLGSTVYIPMSDPRLFMDGIDLEYGLRLKMAGLKNFVVPSAIMEHQFGTPIEFKLWKYYKVFQSYSGLRYFYLCRNYSYLEFKYSKGIYKITCLLRRLKFLGSRIVWILLLEPDQKLGKAWACLQGTYYGLTGNIDRQFGSIKPIPQEISFPVHE